MYRLTGALALAVLSFSASTQAANTLASNSIHAVVAPSYVVRAQGFTTGSDTDGYDLDSVELFLGLVPASELSHALVTLHADDAGMPGDLVARFANPEPLAVGLNTFQAPADTLLEADTTYYLAVNLEADAAIVFGLGVTAGIGDPSASDWSVDDMSWTLRRDGSWGLDVTSVLQFSLAGAPHTPAPTPSVGIVDIADTPSPAPAPAPVANVGPAEAIVSGVGEVQEPVSSVEPPLLIVSNAEQPPSAWSRSVIGQGFTTGSAARSHMLGSVELYLDRPPATAPTLPLVTLHADEAREPGEMLARLRNPDSFTAGANRFRAPFAAVLDGNKTYHVVVNLAADAPQAFSLVTSGKSDVPTGDPEWKVQTGSWLLNDNWLWRANDNHALRFALYEPGENDPAVSSNTPPPESSTPPETGTTTQSQPPSPTPDTSDDDDDTPPPPIRTGKLAPWVAAAGLALGGLSGGSDTPRDQPTSEPPPPPPPSPPSTDATLSGLRVTQTDGTAIALAPSMFSSTVTSYSASVANSVATVKILPTTNHANA